MAFVRPTLTALITQVLSNIVSNLPGADALLRFSNLNVLGKAQAGLAHQHYGYLDYIALQATPYTATDEYLAAWGALRAVYQKPANQATGTVTFAASVDASIPNGTPVSRSDGVQYAVIDSTIGSGSITVTVQANADPSGLTGLFGDCDVGTQFNLGQSISGVTSTGTSGAIVGGADIETEDNFRTRVISAYQTAPQGGAKQDYIDWAQEVPGIVQVWCQPLIYGPGTVGIYILMEPSSGNPHGLPAGTNGVATDEWRGTQATGDQLTVANYIYPLRPVTALVTVLAPVLQSVNLSISGVAPTNRAATESAIGLAISQAAQPGQTLPIASIWSAIASVLANSDYVVQSPTEDITVAAGSIATLGTITWS